MDIISAGTVGGTSIGAMFVIVVALKKFVFGAKGGAVSNFDEKLDLIKKELDESFTYTQSYKSKKQYETLVEQISSESAQLASEKTSLAEIEKKLDNAQKTVEGKEAQQQELKSSKEEDETKLQELLANYQDSSSESIALEQALAASLKNLDTIMKEVTMTADQKLIFEELSNSITAGSSRLRELLTEFQVVNERLQGLQTQHHDLEEEYTKLVEQQLGE